MLFGSAWLHTFRHPKKNSLQEQASEWTGEMCFIGSFIGQFRAENFSVFVVILLRGFMLRCQSCNIVSFSMALHNVKKSIWLVEGPSQIRMVKAVFERVATSVRERDSGFQLIRKVRIVSWAVTFELWKSLWICVSWPRRRETMLEYSRFWLELHGCNLIGKTCALTEKNFFYTENFPFSRA